MEGGGGSDKRLVLCGDFHAHQCLRAFHFVCVCVCVQVDELARCINEIALDVDKIKHNHNVILASVQNQGRQ